MADHAATVDGQDTLQKKRLDWLQVLFGECCDCMARGGWRHGANPANLYGCWWYGVPVVDHSRRGS